MVLSSTAMAEEFDVSTEDYEFTDEVIILDVPTESTDLEYLSEVSPLASIDDSYGVGTSNVSIFSGIVRKLPLTVNYVYWRESQYDYCLAYGSGLVLDGTDFTSDVVDVVTYTTSTGYQSQASFTLSTDSNFTLDASDHLVWSNLGHYPALEDGRDTVAQTVAISCVIAFGLFFVMRVLNYCRRR